MDKNRYFMDIALGNVNIINIESYSNDWNAISSFERSIKKPVESGLSKDEYLDMIRRLGYKSEEDFQIFQQNFLTYLDFLVKNELMDERYRELFASLSYADAKAQLIPQYYFSVDSMWDAIQSSIDVADVYSNSVYDFPAAALLLSWYGLTEEEIINLKQRDILEVGVYLHRDIVYLPGFVLDLLRRIKNSDGYFQMAKGVVFHKFVPSDYLFRTERSEKIDYPKLSGMVTRINMLCDRKYNLTISTARESGIYYRAYMSELNGLSVENSSNEELSRIFKVEITNQPKRNRLLRKYREYKKLMNKTV